MHTIESFQSFVWNFYKNNKREFAWRNNTNPYHVLVSELMLQQTQTHRVIPKYEQFISTFPTIENLAAASLQEVLIVWEGLGYYRRARFLHQLAGIVVAQHGGIIPNTLEGLQALPGIGYATACSVSAFAFNIPTVFIETNIRAVFIHSFFPSRTDVSDKEIMPLVAATVDHDNPREWYYALMDYGVFLKSAHKNPSRKSAHYVKQSRFEGSDRQIRAAIVKYIVKQGAVDKDEIMRYINKDTIRIERIVLALESEKFIRITTDGMYTIF